MEGKMPHNDVDYQRRRKTVALVSLVIVLILSTVVALTIGRKLLHFAADSEGFRTWAQSQGIWGRLTLIGIQMLQVVIALLPGEVVEIAAGYAFGAWEGMLLCLVGTVLGSTIIYLVTKRFGPPLVEAFISREKLQSLKFLQNSRQLNALVFILFFIPGTPKDLLTYCIGLTPMKLRTFLIISTIARIPSVLTSTWGGDALGVKNFQLALIVLGATIIVSALGLFIYTRIVKRRHRS